MKKLLLSFAAGCVGGLVYSISLWLLSDLGVCKQLGVALSIHLSADWIYSRIVWGGIWGFLFLLPMWRSRVLLRGGIFSLVPTAVQLFYVFPQLSHQGLLGLKLGILTPLLILVVTALWGLTSSLSLKMAR